MAAYAALVSLMHTIEQIEHHPHPPVSLNESQVESLTEKVTFLQEFLEGYCHVGYTKEADDLEMRITDAAYAAEDVIESHLVDQIRAGIKSKNFNFFGGLQKVLGHGKKISQRLQKVMQEMDLIKKEVMEMREKTGVHDLMHRQSTPASALRSSSTRQNIMVGFEDVLIKIMDKLTDGQSGREIIPIVGMGGSGKTTLSENVYQNQVVVERFDILAWVTISQEYSVRELLLELLPEEGRKDLIEKSEGEIVHKRLSGKRYLIVLDDIWDIEVWNQLQLSFPNNNNGSRIMLTTRLSNLAYQVGASNVIKMDFLYEENSWDLFCKIVFGKEGCPCELEGIGKKIVRNCNGLPLAIVVVGGLLAKSEQKQEYWEWIEGNLSSVVNSEDDESCLKILHMSYMQLPIFLRPCFLYMGVFREDERIHVSSLVKLWVAEGFLKPIRGKSLEIVAKEYLKDLIDRNLVLVHKLGSTGSIKVCRIHDLLRDLCLREAQKERRFYNVVGRHSLPQCINSKRRIVVVDSISKKKAFALNTSSLVRSLIWESNEKLPSLDFRLLRILKAYERCSNHWDLGKFFKGNILKFVNSRYIAIRLKNDSKFPSSMYLLWNLQTLIFYGLDITIPSEIWKMPQLKHIECRKRLRLPDPPTGGNGGEDEIVLVNLQKIMTVTNFKCGEETIKRIPNIRTLKLRYHTFSDDSSDCCLHNLERLHKLESFQCSFENHISVYSLLKLSFPHWLKKLTLHLHPDLHWQGIMEKIGSLLHLEKLRLRNGSFREQKWETVEGQFQSLKYLEIWGCSELEYWTTEYTHFPRLEHLVLSFLWDLKEIPSDIGEIPTLQSIKVTWCSIAAIISAKEIAREQEELGNNGLQVNIIPGPWSKQLRGLETTSNFQLRLD